MASVQIITISGLAGSGTTTVCDRLCARLGWAYVNAGAVFRRLAQEAGVSLAEFGQRAEADGRIDRQLDVRLVEQARANAPVVVEGRLTGWMAQRHQLPALKVWLQAVLAVRAERVGQREGKPAGASTGGNAPTRGVRGPALRRASPNFYKRLVGVRLGRRYRVLRSPSRLRAHLGAPRSAMSLQGRNILLGVTGGIAAYKTPEIVRLLTAEGAEVRVVLTRAAGEFVAPKTLEVLSRHAVYSNLFGRDAEFPVLHVGLAEWADLILVAPATAHCLGRVASGLADDLLSTVLLCADVPVLLAPVDGGEHVGQCRGCGQCADLGAAGVSPARPGGGAFGRRVRLAAGGCPRPAELVAAVAAHFSGDLAGLKLLVTAGPTVEDLDPVRFISNRSSGKMGYAS